MIASLKIKNVSFQNGKKILFLTFYFHSKFILLALNFWLAFLSTPWAVNVNYLRQN